MKNNSILYENLWNIKLTLSYHLNFVNSGKNQLTNTSMYGKINHKVTNIKSYGILCNNGSV